MAIKINEFTMKSTSKANVDLQCVEVFDDSKKPKGIVQFTHGLSECTEMFMPVLKWLAENGYYVVSMDYLGHGKTVGPGCVGITPSDTNKAIWKDMYNLQKKALKKYPKLPVYMYAHSMGSMMTRTFLVKYKNKVHVNACFLSGDSSLPSVTFLLIPLFHILGVFLSHYPQDLEKRRNTFELKDYGKKVPIVTRAMMSWISFDKEHRTNFANSPYSSGVNASMINILSFVLKAFTTFASADKLGWANKFPDETYIFHGCGRWDIAGFLGFGPKILHSKLEKAGKNHDLKLYKHSMHEVHVEKEAKDGFYKDIIEVFNNY